MKPSAPLTFIYGEEHYLLEEAVSTARKSVDDIRHFSDTFDLNLLSEACLSQDLFSASKLILIRNPWFLLKAVSDDEISQITALFSTPDMPCKIIIACTAKVDMRKKLAAWLKKNSTCTECVGFKDWEQEKLIQWIMKKIQGSGKKIALDAAISLVELVGNDLQLIVSELDKCIVFLGERETITREDIYKLSAGAAGRLFQFTEALKEKNMSSALQSMTRLIDNSEDPIKLLGLLGASLRLYLQLRQGLDANVPIATLAQKLGKNPFFLKQLAPSIQKKHSVLGLKRLLGRICEIDVMIKSGRIAPLKGLQLMVINFCEPA